MRGRGASSGTSAKGNKYGTQYRSLLTSGNIKYVTKTDASSETIMETMTRGRVYAVVDNGRVKSIVYFDNENKRSKQIDLTRAHGGIIPHTHHGYFHNENDSSFGAARITAEEKKMVDRVLEIWDNHAKQAT